MVQIQPVGGNTKPPAPGVNLWDQNYGYVKKKVNGVDTLVYKNPAGLGELLGTTRIQGVYDLLGNNAAASSPFAAPLVGGVNPNRDMTADQAMYLIEHTTPEQLAAVQMKMYQAGLYAGKDIPTLGVYQKKDKDAFRKLLVGLASSPGQGPIGGYLDAVSTLAPDKGPTRAPLVIKHIDDKVLQATFQQAATQLLGEFLPQDQLNGMVAAYHQLESTNAQTAYNLGDPSLTGTLGGAGGDANTTPAPSDYAASQLQSINPSQYAANSLGSKVMNTLNSLRTTGYLPSG